MTARAKRSCHETKGEGKRRMGIGINAWVWTSPFSDKTLNLIDKAKKMGFDSFEVPVEDPKLITAAKLKEAFKRTGLKPLICGAFGPSRDLTHEDPKYRKESLDYILECLKLAQAVGATIVAGPMYSAVGKRRHIPAAQKKKEWDLAVKGLKQAGKMAADFGVTLAIEPINRFEIDLINTAAQAKKMVKDVAHSNVKIHLDTFHMNIEEKSFYEAITLAGKDLAHMHVCENDRGTPGSGIVDWADVANALKKVGYKGECVIESFTPECKAIAAATAIWRPLAKSQDALASDGLKNLKKLLK
jgi:D-psicose/D-tagatose/L-ribulose 3-epimerase